ncbi:Hypothetical_protein [Hexamita inflata]|uniref:Hypothetical_protein n=1 Tax=Hexamita inflata TaxID=28002 RepID=A0AA86QFP1_9EUKA|nr:Hypothetical protein HINF_LOCUS46099 [Hexamita inflata]
MPMQQQFAVFMKILEQQLFLTHAKQDQMQQLVMLTFIHIVAHHKDIGTRIPKPASILLIQEIINVLYQIFLYINQLPINQLSILLIVCSIKNTITSVQLNRHLHFKRQILPRNRQVNKLNKQIQLNKFSVYFIYKVIPQHLSPIKIRNVQIERYLQTVYSQSLSNINFVAQVQDVVQQRAHLVRLGFFSSNLTTLSAMLELLSKAPTHLAGLLRKAILTFVFRQNLEVLSSTLLTFFSLIITFLNILCRQSVERCVPTEM